MFNADQSVLLGKTQQHLAASGDYAGVMHVDAVPAFSEMVKAAAQDGIDLCIISGFRSYQRQLAIWNAKATGQRELLDARGEALPFESLSKTQILHAILRWSALPGASRHHWGTDIDVYDRAQLPEGYQIQLIPAEYQPGGPFSMLSEWLFQYAGEFNFYRPYARDRGGVAPEAWHLSYRPLAQCFAADLTPQLVQSALEDSNITLLDEICCQLPAIFARYVQVE